MIASQSLLEQFIDDADRAYQYARTEVFDKLPVASVLDPEQLTRPQCLAIERLDAADDALAAYRTEVRSQGRE
jgi:hypothetical protein